MMRRALLTSAAMIGLSVTGALAADLPPSYYKAAPPAAAVPTWTGLYVGAHVGAGFSTVESNTDSAILGPGGFTVPLSNGTGSGVIGGGQIGYNVQAGWLVYGIEGSFTASSIGNDAPCLGGVLTCSADAKWYAAITGRVGGLINDRTLAYVKGGAVWQDVDYEIGVPGLFTASASETRLGYLIGAGVEYKFTERLSGFSEYNFMDFGSDSYNFVIPVVGPGVALPANVKDSTHVFKVGVNYKLF